MSGIVRNTVCAFGLKNLLKSTSMNRIITSQVSRSLWHMSNTINNVGIANSTIVKQHQQKQLNCMNGHNYQCRCSQHTKAEKELIEFLAEEIVAEKKAQKSKTIPTELDGFAVSLDGANVTLVKKVNDEKIRIAFNVNHTVDTESEPEIDPSEDKPNFGEMKSKPNFTVDIVRGNQTLGLTCSFNNEYGASGADDSYNDCFGIDEVTLYEGEHSDKVYAVAGEVIDGYLYDLMMNYLEEKGISNEFAEKLVELSTNYEHSAYISLLEGLSKFTTHK